MFTMHSKLIKLSSCQQNRQNTSKLAVKEVGSHQQLQCYFRRNGKLWYLRTAVGVAHLVAEVHADFAQNMGAGEEMQ